MFPEIGGKNNSILYRPPLKLLDPRQRNVLNGVCSAKPRYESNVAGINTNPYVTLTSSVRKELR